MTSARVGVLLGSFDPLHRAHTWMANHLLRRFGATALLIPARHFNKTIHFPDNAHLHQRLRMLDLHRQRLKGRIYVGLAREVLFLELVGVLARRLPGVEVWFGLGQGTFGRLLDSERYYRRAGRPWGQRERELLARIRRRVVVFSRGDQVAVGVDPVTLPADLRGLSSTEVRAAAAALWADGAAGRAWRASLVPRVPAGVVGWIRRNGLYRSSSTRFNSARG